MKTKDAIKYLTDMAGEGSWLSKHCGDAVREVLGRLHAVEIEAAHVPDLRDEITQLKTALTIKNGTIEQLKARIVDLEECLHAISMAMQEPDRHDEEIAEWVINTLCLEKPHTPIIDQLKARMAELEAKAVPEGHALVPVEPTLEMIAELAFNGEVELARGHADICEDVAHDYRAALAVAPKPTKTYCGACSSGCDSCRVVAESPPIGDEEGGES